MDKLSEDENLINVSKILVYYIWMYMDSLKWLNENKENPSINNFFFNSILEGHLLYTRVLIEFLTKESKYSDDRFAESFFYDMATNPYPISLKYFDDYKTTLDKQIAHLTLGEASEFKLKSFQKYKIFQVAELLIPELRNFISLLPDQRLDGEAKENSMKLLIVPPDIDMNYSLHATT